MLFLCIFREISGIYSILLSYSWLRRGLCRSSLKPLMSPWKKMLWRSPVLFRVSTLWLPNVNQWDKSPSRSPALPMEPASSVVYRPSTRQRNIWTVEYTKLVLCENLVTSCSSRLRNWTVFHSCDKTLYSKTVFRKLSYHNDPSRFAN